MQISVKTLKGHQFDLQVAEDELVSSVKGKIEESQRREAFPCAQQLLIFQGKVLKDETTMADNKVADNSFLVVMLTKTKAAPPAAGAPAPAAAAGPPASSSSASVQTLAPSPPALSPAPAPTPAPVPPAALAPAPAVVAPPLPEASTAGAPAGAGDGYGQAASNLVAGSAREQTVQQLLDMGGGTWDRDTVTRALQAAFNNPERAVEYLYSGIPEFAEVPAPVARPTPTGAAAPVPAAPVPVPGAPAAPVGPNAAPLDLFPQGMPGRGAEPGALDFLQNNPQFQALRTMVHANPQILQPMLQELGRQNPALLRLINENQTEFLRLVNEDAPEGNAMAGGVYPQSMNVTPEERQSIERLEAMGFNRGLVIEAFLACDKNEQLAANYLFEHAGDEDL